MSIRPGDNRDSCFAVLDRLRSTGSVRVRGLAPRVRLTEQEVGGGKYPNTVTAVPVGNTFASEAVIGTVSGNNYVPDHDDVVRVTDRAALRLWLEGKCGSSVAMLQFGDTVSYQLV